MTDSSSLTDAIAALGLGVDVAEFHGGVCGILCASGPGAVPMWIRESSDVESPIGDSSAASATLMALEAECWSELSGAELTFYPLLPDGETLLSERVAALAAWCQGFVTGLGLGGYGPDANGLRAELACDRAQVEEIVADLVEISRVTLDEEALESGEQAGFDLAELVEYVRVGVQLIFEELDGLRAHTQPSTH